MATFTYTPDFGAAVSTKPSVRSIKFSDGYEQRVVYGINTQPQAWDLRFVNRDDTEANGIEAFLAAARGQDWFYWTPPNGTVALKYVCREWQRSVERQNLNTVTGKFEQVFDL